MFERRRSGPTAAWLRVSAGLGAIVLGGAALTAIVLWADAADPEAFWISAVLCVGVIAAGLLWLVGVLFSVGGYGERPAAMPLARRLALDAFGYLFALCLVSVFAFFALSPSVHWGEGAANFVPRVLFGLFALVFGVASTSTLIDAIRRALRGEPYDDKSPSRPEVR